MRKIDKNYVLKDIRIKPKAILVDNDVIMQ